MNTKTGRLIQLALGGVFVMTALVLVRANRVEAVDVIPAANPGGAAENYRDRMDATYRLLESERLVLGTK